MYGRQLKDLKRNFSNMLGWQTNRRIVVFESDDWGSIRMPSKEVLNLLEKNGLNMSGESRYNQYDSLASPDDLNALFDLLSSFRDKDNRYCVFTALSVVANPDFKKIEENNFTRYFYEPFTDTLKRYYSYDSFSLWKKGIAEGVFIPQFHSREHLNVGEWMRDLRRYDTEAMLAFQHNFWGFSRKSSRNARISYQAAFDFWDPQDLTIHAEAIEEGLNLFHDLFGYRARFFVPPNGPFNTSLEEVAANCGIKYVSISKIDKVPLGYGKKKIKLHWLGQRNKNGQRYLVRNCFFEPSQIGNDWVKSCLKEIDIAFHWHKPAIISTHRVNYIGALDLKNRHNGLHELNLLLKSIKQQWPDIEFMTSEQLGDLIETGIVDDK